VEIFYLYGIFVSYYSSHICGFKGNVVIFFNRLVDCIQKIIYMIWIMNLNMKINQIYLLNLGGNMYR